MICLRSDYYKPFFIILTPSSITASLYLFAEREGFEPPVAFTTPVFKTGAFDHSATSPITIVLCCYLNVLIVLDEFIQSIIQIFNFIQCFLNFHTRCDLITKFIFCFIKSRINVTINFVHIILIVVM